MDNLPEAIECAQLIANESRSSECGNRRSAYLVQFMDTIKVYRFKPKHHIMMTVRPEGYYHARF